MTASLWLKDRKFDLLFFHLSALVFLLLVLPYYWWGAAVVFPIYNIYLIFFGLPHNYLTWSTLLPASARKQFRLEPIINAAIVCLIISLLIPFSRGTDLNDWILSFISYYSLWHAYRQHHGICKIYDSVQAKRTGDHTIFADRKVLNLFFGLASFIIVVWAFTHPRIDYLLSSTESYRLIYPQVSSQLFEIYCAVTAVIGLYAFKRAVYDRWRRGAFIPWPQLLLMAMALLTYIVPYIFIPIEAMPLAVAIATMYHNVQYFGFVWLFERHRSEELKTTGTPLQLPQKLAAQGAFKKYFALAFVYSFLVVGFYMISPTQVGLTFIYFIGLSHYIIDGYLWRRDINTSVTGFVGNLAKWASATPKNPSALSPNPALATPIKFSLSAQRPADQDL